jgi:hypothetical protein
MHVSGSCVVASAVMKSGKGMADVGGIDLSIWNSVDDWLSPPSSPSVSTRISLEGCQCNDTPYVYWLSVNRTCCPLK